MIEMKLVVIKNLFRLFTMWWVGSGGWMDGWVGGGWMDEWWLDNGWVVDGWRVDG